MGGVIIGHEMGRALGKPAMFVERPQGVFELRRGFRLEPGAQGADGRGRGHHRSVVARSDRGGRGGRRRRDRRSCAGRPLGRHGRLGVPFFPLIRIDVPTYAADAVPPELAAIPRSSPGAAAASLTGSALRLGVNIDHVATIRNARGGDHPDPVRAAVIAAEAGADGITAHLREDRRHITDDDIDRLMAEIDAAAEPRNGGDRGDARRSRSRQARTPPASSPRSARSGPPRAGSTPPASTSSCAYFVDRLGAADIRVSLFIEPDPSPGRGRRPPRRAGRRVPHRPLRPCRRRGRAPSSCKRIADCAALAVKNGIEPHAGHGLTFDNVDAGRRHPAVAELNIGHFLIGEAIFTGLDASVRRMRGADGRGAGMSAKSPLSRRSGRVLARQVGGCAASLRLAHVPLLRRLCLSRGRERASYDRRHRLRPVQHRADPEFARPVGRQVRRPRLHRDRARQGRVGAPHHAPARSPNASPPRKPSPRRSAPASSAASI